MATSKMRVEIPKNPKEELELAEQIYKHHTDVGAASPLNSMTDFNWAAEGPKVATCLEWHKKAEAYKKQMEEAYKERDLLLKGIDEAVKATRDVLTGINRSNMKRMADWGFVVIESAKSSGGGASTEGK
ncbi:MAG TPA: hypothetical protein DCQ26_08695 [Marinilabiliales bacterium]|nr:MAG: hypothetical protein A2W95_18475 [Bacteroidetes bacterium GWA2_40_14]OFX75801.1 MAG: hypothetical protein A2W96_09570 [Bacteroidetes bacterium GWD2_40_43]OFX94926.1 MAG: hypothetical protein A2W97_16270 [Bacteroidetes bacterium GWE2_40_63]OFY23440.1 MAG: hypothetical protein A2W88_08080 [Bacteroidetes bacterium GWF2_40_13]OFZ29433.1 MAG: hypothetical protein A2437_09515 [Bacteroidetes bacterium RIFOXYC2_FULL_40_12]HAM98678.1 hypothetical protein [Marinilabiliales bacterium]